MDGLDGAEAVDALPVLADAGRLDGASARASREPERRRAAAAVLPAAQAAAVAAGGFVAGAAVVGLVQRRQRRTAAVARGRGRRLGRSKASRGREGAAGQLVQIVGTRSLLLDVHLLGGGAER